MFCLDMTSPESSLPVSLRWWFSELFENTLGLAKLQIFLFSLIRFSNSLVGYHVSPIIIHSHLKGTTVHLQFFMPKNVISKWKLLKSYPSNITKIMEMLANLFEEIVDVCTSLPPRSPIFYWKMQSNRSKLAQCMWLLFIHST